MLLPGSVVGVVALVLVAALTGGERGGAGLREPALRPSAPRTASALEALIGELQQFVESTRGLAFKHPVQVQVLEEAAFRRRIRALIRPSLVEGNRRQRVLKAFGLIPADLTLSRAEQESASSSIVGLYDPRTNRLVVRGKEPTPYVRSVLVHELTHALQDQHFDLSRNRPRSGGAAKGWLAVVEGDATRVEDLYLASLSADERDQAAEELAAIQAEPSEIPPAVARFIAFPYQVGPQFTSTLLRLSGQSGLDRAFSTPPRTDEQLLHPVVYVAGEAGVSVPEPEADRRRVLADTFGEFGLRVLLTDVVPQDEIERATSGWGGDRYVVWADGRRNCARLHVLMDTASDAEELAASLGTWAAASGATVEGRAPIVVTSCR